MFRNGTPLEGTFRIETRLCLYVERGRTTGTSEVSAPILRSTGIVRTPIRMRNPSGTSREERTLVARAFHMTLSANARRILLVSPLPGDGKTHLAHCILRHANVVTDEQVRVLALESLPSRAETATGYVWVDGVSLLDGAGAAALTPAMRAWFHGALLVVRGMVTTREQVRECAEQLRILGMDVLGGVWNERDCPPPAETLLALQEGLRTWPPRLPPGFFARQFRRSP